MDGLYNSLYEESQEALERLAQYATDHLTKLNEATTRLHLIDTLLFECLGWEKRDAIAEEHQRTDRDEYTDYTFYAPRKLMILEAKRAGATFTIPAGKVSNTYSIPSLFRGNQALTDAVRQCASYCQNRGVPIGIVSNGHQIVAFIATRSDGIEPLKGKAVVYPSLREILKNFAEAWSYLSRPGLEDGKLARHLLGASRPQTPLPLSASLPSYPGTKGRNVFQADLKHIAELVIEDIPGNPDIQQEFLKRCYCQSGVLSQHSFASRSMLKSRYTALFDADAQERPALTPASTTKGISQELYATSLGRRPVLLIGDVGVGKSMFIRNLIDVEAAEILSKSYCFYIDLGFSATLAADLHEFIVTQLIDQLSSKYGLNIDHSEIVRETYKADLEDLRKGILGELAATNPAKFAEREIASLEAKVANRPEHFRRSLEYLFKRNRKQAVIFIDNADQRGDAVQDEAFLISQEIAAKWPALVYIPLRPETFHRSVNAGALSGYHPKAFTVSPPKADMVVNRRLEYALTLTQDLKNTMEDDAGAIDGISAVIKSFLHTLVTQSDIPECLENLCGGNIRQSLGLVKAFFGSGHVDTSKIVTIVENDGRYIIPIHEFLRTIIYGDYIYYHPDRSPIANLFDISHNDTREHFLLSLLLSRLRTEKAAAEGFVLTDDLYADMQGYGFTPDQIDYAVVRASRKRLIESPTSKYNDDDGRSARKFRATTSGLYHIDRLIYQMAYIDAVVVATPILVEDKRERIADAIPIADRIDRARVFKVYLDDIWVSSGLSTSALQWPEISSKLGESIDAAERGSKRRKLK